MSILKGKHIILGITGGIAAYKSVYLLRLLVKAGAEVQVVITPSGREFITPVTLSSLSGRPVISEFFTANTGQWNSHVDLGLWADAMVIAPATASTIGKMAGGIADNMLVTTYLSAKEQVFVAPAMDLDMWAHPSTQRNVATLRADGVEIVEPGSGELASHLCGKGRMAEPEQIVEALEQWFLRHDTTLPLKGKRILITAGPTYENIDPVRFIGNHSSGKMGYALAAACREQGAEVVLVSGPVSLPAPAGVERVSVTSACEMLEASRRAFDTCHAAIFCAAVADYAPAVVAESKIKREGAEIMCIELKRNPDIAASLSREKGKRLTIGFALETDNGADNARRKLEAKNLDWVVLNRLGDPGAGFGVDTNSVTLFSRGGEELSFPVKSKQEVARDIVATVFSLR
ncbi:MAG: bifunctional phosphopantothenoylcysteine decarboxylase/phosphopantothenate--cysteine ligase CoaBC [Porphyromonadaceae bacterium]|nr:bifunctional phosphopantothenoylcysteine decarboxylase/phosphopantothenate--cysteine ligase CoaBC [Porphyromonadaceae bacterium]